MTIMPAWTQQDERAMSRALELAREAADAREAPIGAVIYNHETNQTVAEARNTRERDNDPAGHAEFTAIREACRKINDWRLTNHTLVVTLEPCPMCAGLVWASRIDRLVYAAPDPKAGACRSLFNITDDPRLNHRAEVIEGLYADEAAALLKDFFKALRSKPPS